MLTSKQQNKFFYNGWAIKRGGGHFWKGGIQNTFQAILGLKNKKFRRPLSSREARGKALMAWPVSIFFGGFL